MAFEDPCTLEGLSDDEFKQKIFLAAREGHTDVFESNYTYISRALQHKQLLDDDMRSPLHVAASHGHPVIVELCLRVGVDYNLTDESGWTCLHCACSAGHLLVVCALLERIDVDYPPHFLDKCTENGNTALLYAASKGNLEIVKILQRKGSDINKENALNQTPLSRAVATGREEVVEFLLSHPQVNLRVKERVSGDNLLHLAVGADRADIFYLLTKACPEMEEEKNSAGKRPLETASRDYMKKLEYVFKSFNKSEEDEIAG